ncbi:MAG: hypothetical protein GX949_02825 [Peptococcaceae bacterium]|jgi:hypothetical protein|nr:hypothetical protein [Peptococcaceae bacterium]
MREGVLMSFDYEIDIPFDVIRLDKHAYLVPHGIPIKTEPLIKIGVDRITLVNRNVTVGLPSTDEERDKREEVIGSDRDFTSHPLFPADEYLEVRANPPIIVRFSNKLLETLGITMEVIYDYYSASNERILNVDPSQLTISRGKLMIGKASTEPMMIVWTGSRFVIMPTSTKLAEDEVAVEEVDGAVASGMFRCKYGMIEIVTR